MNKINELFKRLELDWNIENCVIEKYEIAESKKEDVYFKDENDNGDLVQEIVDILEPLDFDIFLSETFKNVFIDGVDIRNINNDIVYISTYNTNDDYYEKYLYVIKQDNLEINLEDIFKEFSNNRIDNNGATVYKFNEEEK